MGNCGESLLDIAVFRCDSASASSSSVVVLVFRKGLAGGAEKSGLNASKMSPRSLAGPFGVIGLTCRFCGDRDSADLRGERLLLLLDGLAWDGGGRCEEGGSCIGVTGLSIIGRCEVAVWV